MVVTLFVTTVSVYNTSRNDAKSHNLHVLYAILVVKAAILVVKALTVEARKQFLLLNDNSAIDFNK